MKKKNTITNIKINSEIKKEIVALAVLEGISVSVWVRNAIRSDLSQESDIKRIDKNVEFLSKLFINFTKSFGGLSNEEKEY